MYGYAPIVDQALQVAYRAHAGQLRKGDGSPFILHPIMVATICVRYGTPDDVVAAALLHDVLEDCPDRYSRDRMAEEFGEPITRLVEGVTEVKTENGQPLPWETRKLAYLDHLRSAPEGSWLICCADKIHNIHAVVAAYERYGDALWNSFNSPAHKRLWLYEQVLAWLHDWPHPILRELAEALESLRGVLQSPAT